MRSKTRRTSPRVVPRPVLKSATLPQLETNLRDNVLYVDEWMGTEYRIRNVIVNDDLSRLVVEQLFKPDKLTLRDYRWEEVTDVNRECAVYKRAFIKLKNLASKLGPLAEAFQSIRLRTPE